MLVSDCGPVGRTRRLLGIAVSAAQCSEIGEHVACEGVHVAHFVPLTDHPVGVDEVRNALGELRELLVGLACHFVGRANAAICIGQQVEVERLRFCERLVLVGGVERCTEDDTLGVGKVFGPVPQALALNRSTGSRCFRIPPQDHPVAALIGEADLVAVLVRQVERGCGGSFGKHVASLCARLRERVDEALPFL